MLEISGSLASTVGKKNPFRYRGYYYDSETEMYYLANRYYNPEVKRFINADDEGVLFIQQDSLLQYNQYAYCLNDPVSRVDESGCLSIPNWAKVVMGVTTITALAVATVVTGGTAAIICGAALTGSVIGGGIGAGVGAVIDGVDGQLQVLQQEL